MASFGVACLCLCFILLAGTVSAKSPPAVARKEDIKYIKCGVCNLIAKELSRQVVKKTQELLPKQITEYQIIELAENICNLKRNEGDWLLHLDIVEEGDKLVIVEQEEEGECKTECKTIEKACQEVMGYHDTDIAEFMFKGALEADALSKHLCKDLTRACHGRIAPVPKDRIPGEVFTPKSSKDAEIERLMRSMSDMPGAPSMKMYSKDDLMRGMPNFNEDDDDEDDDEEDGEDLTSVKETLKKTATNKLSSHMESFFATVRSGTHQAISSAKKHVKKASDRFRSWWPGSSDTKVSDSTATEL